MSKPKILVIDIETKPAIAYVWRMYDEVVNVAQLIEAGGMICFGAQWLGERKVHFYSEWTHTRKQMVKAAHRMLSQADAVITYNGDKFDIPKLNGEFLLEDLPPPPPPTSIDLYKTIRKLGLLSSKLEYVGERMGIGEKVKHEGFRLWRSVMEGDERAMRRMQKYCIQDVRLTGELYQRIKPYIRNHPHVGNSEVPGTCGACGSDHLQSRGTRRTKYFKIQRLQCQACGAWQDGKRSKIK